MKFVLPVILLILGVSSGVGAGLYLSPSGDEEKAEHQEKDCAPAGVDLHAAPLNPSDEQETEYVKLTNQFVVPVVREDRVGAMVVLSLTLEAVAGNKNFIYSHEPKLRDTLLQVLFDHANHGGFDGTFTRGNTMTDLRSALLETARATLGPIVSDILVLDIARQDM